MHSRRETPSHDVERWCNQVAAELLVPLDVFRRDYQPACQPRARSDRLARRFKVSTLVILRRMHDAGGLDTTTFWAAYEAELERLQALPRGSGGDFYLTSAHEPAKIRTRARHQHLGGPVLLHRGVPTARVQEDGDISRVRAEPRVGGLMAYLLDAECLHLGQEPALRTRFLPAFWDWLVQQNASGHGLQH